MTNANFNNSTWHFDHDSTDLVKAIAHVLSVQNSPSEVHGSIAKEHNDFHDIKPVAAYQSPEDGIYGATWHRGQAYEYIVIGSPSSLIQYCDLTSGERESIMLNSQRISADNEEVFAVATGVSSELYPTLSALHQAERLRMCGVVSYAPS